ncbi:hypothetical protein D1345_03755 [Chromobacterium rhizoryzae]|uniref:Uncharacterized protein n=1 Tax=Chromobacterium rhizoryzae TaxID=1778675 RepID=A0AAD0W7H5_9NEIS|nr:hypothetical protein D1345_03755 [Chromobacterium rhizoryzae]
MDQAIDELRDELVQPGKMVRLVGLSGVGKTRLVQALFDARIGSRSLPPSLAVYTDLSDNPSPQPTGLASDLIANRTRAILIIDNCPPDLHHRLSGLCRGQNSTVSVLTVEYDVRDDHPEGTQVVTLDTSSVELIEKLIQRRYSHLSPVDTRTIAEASGGNARIAIALAETVERTETIAGLSNDELFQRLFRQRQESDQALLLAAQACSLVYSFQGEVLTGSEAELPRLAVLAGQTDIALYRHVGELLRRNLAQQRGGWRAVLPHAIANRLAARALESTPYDLINQELVEGGSARLARSFSRRLSFLHDHPQAIAIVERWLAPGGLLGDVAVLNDLGQAMFKNVAPVRPEATLTALERAETSHPDIAATLWRTYRALLRSLAYDPTLFERTARLLTLAATQSMDKQAVKEVTDTFASLFTLHLSGTHATIEQRLGVIERLLKSDEVKAYTLGLAALSKALTTHFSSFYDFEFGARSRDYGYQPQNYEDITKWYGSALHLIERLALTEVVLRPELRKLLAQSFCNLWSFAGVHDELERLARGFAAEEFWREGWSACLRTIRLNKRRQPPRDTSRLSALESRLRPSNLLETVSAVVLSDGSAGFRSELMEEDDDLTTAIERIERKAHELGVMVSMDDALLRILLPDLLRGGHRVQTFGRGLAKASPDPRATWTTLAEELESVPETQRDVRVLMGFLTQLWEQDRNLADELLDLAINQPALASVLPALQSAIKLDEQGVERLKRALHTELAPIWTYKHMAHCQVAEHLPSRALKDLLLLIASQVEGVDVALDILFACFSADRTIRREHAPELLEAGQELLQQVVFRTNNPDEFLLVEIVKSCLTAPDTGAIAGKIAARLRQAVWECGTYSFDNADLLTSLLNVHPLAVLDALFEGSEEDLQAGVNVFDSFGRHQSNPADTISCEQLITWCEEDRERRYQLAASFVTFACSPDEQGPLAWSEQAQVLLTSAPEPRNVLAMFIERFRPMSWGGSRAVLMEANARLLDCLGSLIPDHLTPFVAEAKAKLAQEIESERQWEVERDREKDERFEW